MARADHCRRKPLVWSPKPVSAGTYVASQTIWIVGPFLRKIQRAIDELHGHDGSVGSKDADRQFDILLPNRCIARATPHDALALLEKPVS